MWCYVEFAGLQQKQVAEEQVRRQEVGNRRGAVRYSFTNAGIRNKKPERTDEELKKVTEMVKNKNYNHPEVAILKENDLLRMKVRSAYSKGNNPQANQIITRARAQTRRRREGVQAVPGQSQAGGNAQAIVIKEEEAALGRVREGATLEKRCNKQQSHADFS